MSKANKHCELMKIKGGKEYVNCACGIEKKCENCGWRSDVHEARIHKLDHGRGMQQGKDGNYRLVVPKAFYEEGENRDDKNR